MRADRWYSHQGKLTRGGQLQPGDVVAVDCQGFRHKPWSVHEVKALESGSFRVLLRPVGAQYDFAQYNRGVTMASHAMADVLPEHYSVCARCGELPPCSEVWVSSIADAQSERAARYEVEGVCPACQTPVTRRQNAIRFPENLHVPLGPPVVFHRRQQCEASAVDYDRAVAKSTGRRPWLSCEGSITAHRDEQVCTDPLCPDPKVQHRMWSRCFTPNCDHGCNPSTPKGNTP